MSLDLQQIQGGQQILSAQSDFQILERLRRATKFLRPQVPILVSRQGAKMWFGIARMFARNLCELRAFA